MSNFQFLHSEWRSLYQKVTKAEERVRTEPVSTAQYCRQAMEEAVHHIYRLEQLELPYNTDLANLTSQPDFKSLMSYQIWNGLHIVRKTGNNASHYGNKVSSADALVSIRYLFDFLKWFAQNYSETEPQLPGTFEDNFIPKVGERDRKLKEIQAESERVQKQLEAQLEQLRQEKEALAQQASQSQKANEAYKQQQEAARQRLEEQKEERKAPLPKEFSEAETRRHLIDIDLKEAGWFGLKEGRDLEYPVKGMPVTPDNPKGRAGNHQSYVWLG